MPRRLTRDHIVLALILLLALLGLYAGWRVFWHLTDDAYIAFRYISNAHLGHGYVWNAPPFRPVEGYTSFLWVLLLDVVWRLTGVEPPRAANGIALLFAGGTLLLTAAAALRLRLPAALARWRLAALALVLAGTLSNRTFLAWTSSGLETAMFNFWVMAWVFSAMCLPPRGTAWLGLLTSLAALMALTRPDGLLFLAATLALAGAGWWAEARAGRWRARQLAALAPAALAGLHLLVRRAFYGQWLPNTYYAKSVGAWPESGVRYLLSFVMEYGLWLWLALAALFVLAQARHIRRAPGAARRWLSDPLTPSAARWMAVGALTAHFAYYTFIIGGDHFEYRVYSHVIPLLWLSLAWLAGRAWPRPAVALPVLAFCLAAAQPLPWAHWALSQPYTTRLETFGLTLPVAQVFPPPLRAYAQAFDDLQAWLIARAVGARHQEHKVFTQSQLAALPPRETGLLISPSAQAVFVEGAVGVAGWVLPTMAIVDYNGLNDAVIARAPLDPDAPRQMAHDRTPPAGYLECFETNASAGLNKIIIGQRAQALTSTAPACEGRAWPPVPRSDADGPFNLTLAPGAAHELGRLWSPDPLIIYYVPPGQTPVQPAADLLAAFKDGYHDVGCLVFPPPEAADGYQLALLPPNLRYAPTELRALFPWAGVANFERSSAPAPYSLAYALPADGPADGPAPSPSVAHAVHFADASLIGFDTRGARSDSLEAGGTLEVTLYFAARSTAAGEQWFRLSLVAAQGEGAPATPIASDQADPCRGLYPAPLWVPGQVIVAKALIYVPAELPAGRYGLRLDMFDLAAGPDALMEAEGEQGLAVFDVGEP